MDIAQIQTCLASENPQDRMRAITALRSYDAQIAVPLLQEHLGDREPMIRSFVAMGLGRKQTPAAFEALLRLLRGDRDGNVRAEAANSLAKYGPVAIPHLVTAFRQNSDWIIRLSILPVLAELGCPDQLWEVCICALVDADPTVRDTGIEYLADLVGTARQEDALQQLLVLTKAERWRTRCQVAFALRAFADERARSALQSLRKDADHRVVGATLEALLQTVG